MYKDVLTHLFASFSLCVLRSFSFGFFRAKVEQSSESSDSAFMHANVRQSRDCHCLLGCKESRDLAFMLVKFRQSRGCHHQLCHGESSDLAFMWVKVVIAY